MLRTVVGAQDIVINVGSMKTCGADFILCGITWMFLS